MIVWDFNFLHSLWCRLLIQDAINMHSVSGDDKTCRGTDLTSPLCANIVHSVQTTFDTSSSISYLAACYWVLSGCFAWYEFWLQENRVVVLFLYCQVHQHHHIFASSEFWCLQESLKHSCLFMYIWPLMLTLEKLCVFCTILTMCNGCVYKHEWVDGICNGDSVLLFWSRQC